MYMEIYLQCAHCPFDDDCGIRCNQPEMLHVIFAVHLSLFFQFFHVFSLPCMVFKANIHLMSLYVKYVCGRENYSIHFLKWRVWKFGGSNTLQTPLSKVEKRRNGRTNIIA